MDPSFNILAVIVGLAAISRHLVIRRFGNGAKSVIGKLALDEIRTVDELACPQGMTLLVRKAVELAGKCALAKVVDDQQQHRRTYEHAGDQRKQGRAGAGNLEHHARQQARHAENGHRGPSGTQV